MGERSVPGEADSPLAALRRPLSPPSSLSETQEPEACFCLSGASVLGWSSEPRWSAPKQTLSYTELENKKNTPRCSILKLFRVSHGPVICGLKGQVQQAPAPCAGLAPEKQPRMMSWGRTRCPGVAPGWPQAFSHPPSPLLTEP